MRITARVGVTLAGCLLCMHVLGGLSGCQTDPDLVAPIALYEGRLLDAAGNPLAGVAVAYTPYPSDENNLNLLRAAMQEWLQIHPGLPTNMGQTDDEGMFSAFVPLWTSHQVVDNGVGYLHVWRDGAWLSMQVMPDAGWLQMVKSPEWSKSHGLARIVKLPDVYVSGTGMAVSPGMGRRFGDVTNATIAVEDSSEERI